MSGQTSNASQTRPLAPPAAPAPFRGEDCPPGLLIYVALADHLAEEIRRGVYPVGSQLPTVRALSEQAHVTAGTVTKAYDVLAKQGTITIVDRKGAFVRLIPTYSDVVTNHDPGGDNDPQPPRPPAPTAPLATPQQRPMQTVHAQSHLPPSRVRIAHIATDVWTPHPDIAAALRQDDYTAPVNVRYRVIVDAATGHPVEIRTSYTPAAIAANTPLNQPTELPGPWSTVLYEATGYTPATATATTSSRHPNPSEAQTLGIPEHGIVLVRDTVLYATRDTTGAALDMTRSVWPADSTRITLAYPVTVG